MQKASYEATIRFEKQWKAAGMPDFWDWDGVRIDMRDIRPLFEDPKFETKDSGKRIEHASGMVRDTTEGKIDYTLALDGPMFQRYAELMDRGAVKYGKRNWMKADSQEEMDRARESLVRHFFQYIAGHTDEDHAAAILFNLNEIEYVKDRINQVPVCSSKINTRPGGPIVQCNKSDGHDGSHRGREVPTDKMTEWGW